jgi:hypothetical protein
MRTAMGIMKPVRTPYFLFAAIVIPVLEAIVFSIIYKVEYIQVFSPDLKQIGGYYVLSVGSWIPIDIEGCTILLGLVLTSISLFRRENFRAVVICCFCIYLLPVVLTLVLLVSNALRIAFSNFP